jgi:hypothetical protein
MQDDEKAMSYEMPSKSEVLFISRIERRNKPEKQYTE